MPKLYSSPNEDRYESTIVRDGVGSYTLSIDSSSINCPSILRLLRNGGSTISGGTTNFSIAEGFTRRYSNLVDFFSREIPR